METIELLTKLLELFTAIMNTINPTQVKQIQTICSKRFSDREERLDFLSNVLGEEINSTKNLTELQASDLIHFLNTGTMPDNRSWGLFNAKNGQHRALLSRCHQLGWVQEDQRHLVDLNRLGGWLKSKKSPVQKPLLKMKKEEVSKVIAALDSIIKKRYK